MKKSSPASRYIKDVHRSAQPILSYDIGAVSRLLPNAVILPEQFYASSTEGQVQDGEVALRRRCFQRRFVRRDRRVQRLAQEAEEWFTADDADWPFSFVNICAVLRLEPDYIRRGLKRWCERYGDTAERVTSVRSFRFAA
ncbi:MAG: hypothetical protein J4F42_08570 [Desulfurellaceae bacterium]|nr:hypothetical protein [Desulfurellaceae bacterium]